MDVDGYYVTDQDGYAMRTGNGDLVVMETREAAEDWIVKLLRTGKYRYVWLKTLDDETVCQYVRDMLAN